MLQRQTHAGKLAFELERNEEAAAQYRTALSRAQARDDPDAIGDTGYNLAVAELRANAPDKALADARAQDRGWQLMARDRLLDGKLLCTIFVLGARRGVLRRGGCFPVEHLTAG